MFSDKQGIRDLVAICAEKGLRYIVISPGSRNAPLTISFDQHPDIECLSIADERCAAFFAMGMAQQLQEPVAIACTSGSAALNYAPAIAEAYYQKIPLVVLTADRPNEWTDQSDGQTIRQYGLYDNYIKASYELPQEASDEDTLWHNRRLISDAFNTAMYPGKGPVHINTPLREPLYGQKEYDGSKPKHITIHKEERTLSDETMQQFADRWNTASKKLIVTGVLAPNEKLNDHIAHLAQDPSLAVLTETTSNLHHPAFNPCIDRIAFTIKPEEAKDFAPALLVTFGGPVISKKIKAFLREQKPKEHWHIDPTDVNIDTYQNLTDVIPLEPEVFFSKLSALTKPVESNFAATWKARDKRSEARHAEFMPTIDFSDFKAFEKVLALAPKSTCFQLGNSTPVRYAQLFHPTHATESYANRGTSGIDGSTSTAAGAAFATGKSTTLITGDMAFFYDSNALWNKHLTGNLKIILINNGGGGIFRIIPGPSSTNQLEQFFETKHDNRAEHICKAHNIAYLEAKNEAELEANLQKLYSIDDYRPALLEIITPGDENDKILKSYWKKLNA